MNLALKSGTNPFHGAASYYNRDDSRSANLFASNARGTAKYRRATTTASAARSAARSSATRRSSWARTRSCRTTRSRPFTSSVPTERMRNGDFSELLAAGIQIYNPLLGAAGQRRRHARSVPGQHHPGEPAQPDRAATCSSTSRCRTRPAPPTLSQQLLRRAAVDLRLRLPDGARRPPVDRRTPHLRPLDRATSAARSATTGRARSTASRSRAAAPTASTSTSRSATPPCCRQRTGSRPEGQLPALQRRPVPAHAVRSGRASATRSRRWRCSAATSTPALQHRVGQRRPTAGARRRRSAASRTASTPAATSRSTTCSSRRRSPKTSARTPQVRATTGARCARPRPTRAGAAAPTAFDSSYTRASSHGAPASTARASRRSCSACRPTTRSSSCAPEYDYAVVSHGVFVHDDWRVTDRLTLNLGVRYDLELGMTEAENRNIARLRLHDGEPDPGGRRRRATRPTRRPACR